MTNTNRLAATVHSEGMIWGNDVADQYHGVAASHMEAHWGNYIQSFMDHYPFDLTKTIDFAAGFGRNTRKLLEAGADHVTMVDLNPDCIAALREKLVGPRATVFQNNGYDLSGISDQAATFFYSFDAMVHFDLEVIISYIPEIARVLKDGGYALIHHSNFSDNPGGDFKKNPHYRNFMTASIVKHVAIRSGLEVVEQRKVPWGGEDIDCISVLRKSGRV